MMKNQIPLIQASESQAYDLPYSFQLNYECTRLENIFRDNILVNKNLSESLGILNTTVSDYVHSINPLAPYIPIFAVISGTILGYFLTRFHWSFSEGKKKEAEFITKISALVSEIEKTSVKYWINASSSEDSENEIYIKSKIRLLNKYVSLINCKQLHLKERLESFSSELFDLATGDDFESPARLASKSKAGKISYLCSSMNLNLSTIK